MHLNGGYRLAAAGVFTAAIEGFSLSWGAVSWLLFGDLPQGFEISEACEFRLLCAHDREIIEAFLGILV